MRNTMRFVLALSLGAILALTQLGAPASAQAEEPVPAAMRAPDADAPQVQHVEYWRARGDAARARVADAQAELDEANAAVSRMRRRNHPRGDARIQLQEERTQAQSAYDEAVRYLDVELPAEARAAGAQQAWLRERP